jgi:glycosyltransferase involved in cell wall biosynthesis
VVSTPIGAEGLPFHDGRQIRIAEQPEQFARAVVELVKNASLRNSIAQAARDEVVNHHGWEPVVARVEHILEHVMRQSKHASAA